MEEWLITEIREDFDGAEDRWLIVFQVPTKYAPDGVFSYSFPKSAFSYRAAEFGYNVDDPDDREALFQHVIHGGYLGATGQLTASGDLNPVRKQRLVAKQAVTERLASVRSTLRVTQADRPVLKVAGRAGLAAKTPADVLDVIRADMRIDRDLIANWGTKVDEIRADHARTEKMRSEHG